MKIKEVNSNKFNSYHFLKEMCGNKGKTVLMSFDFENVCLEMQNNYS